MSTRMDVTTKFSSAAHFLASPDGSAHSHD